MRFFLLFLLVTAPALSFLLNVANANQIEKGVVGEEGVVSLETRLEFAEEAEREIESDFVFPGYAHFVLNAPSPYITHPPPDITPAPLA